MAIAWLDNKKEISIHALREEGDGAADLIEAVQNDISIHALREEGDPLLPVYCIGKKYFYPRPPRGGRLLLCEISARLRSISIHALREEGDCFYARFRHGSVQFLSTPSARRATPRRRGPAAS